MNYRRAIHEALDDEAKQGRDPYACRSLGEIADRLRGRGDWFNSVPENELRHHISTWLHGPIT